jgi:hypothetical protein
MTDGAAPPPARKRYRHGIKNFDVDVPQPREALLDRVELRLRGTLVSPCEDGFARFAERVSEGSAMPLFGKMQRRGGRWEASVVGGSTISSGRLTIHHKGPDAWLDLTLVVNPTRTLAHLLDRFRFEEFERLDATTFFSRSPMPSSPNRTLDGRDNMVSDFLTFSGSVHSTFLQRVARYLEKFERALVRYVVDELCPPEYQCEVVARDGMVITSNDTVQLTLDWGGLTVSQCEVCWERHDPAALERVDSLAAAVLTAARSATVGTHGLRDGSSVDRNLGALSVKMPIVPDRIALAVYAKALDRLRFEVRYSSNLPDEVGARLPQPPRRLTDWFDAIRDEAATRVPWGNLQQLLVPAEDANIDVLAEFLDAIADVTSKARPKRRSLLRQLLRHGAVSATNRDGDAPSTLLERLADRGILQHARLVGRDAKRGRRYCLTDRYRALVGIIPTDHG